MMPECIDCAGCSGRQKNDLNTQGLMYWAEIEDRMTSISQQRDKVIPGEHREKWLTGIGVLRYLKSLHCSKKSWNQWVKWDTHSTPIFVIKYLFILCVWVFLAFMFACLLCVQWLKRQEEGQLNPLELLQMVVNHCVGAENSYWYIKDTQ